MNLEDYTLANMVPIKSVKFTLPKTTLKVHFFPHKVVAMNKKLRTHS